jgi:hypothetical protein
MKYKLKFILVIIYKKNFVYYSKYKNYIEMLILYLIVIFIVINS